MSQPKPYAFKNYLSLVKFSHTIFAMPFALVGFFLATQYHSYDFSWKLFALVVLCMVFARNSAMSFNRVTDRFIDKRNPRTASREIPSGVIHPRHAFLFSVINALLFIITTFFINKLVFYLSPIALLIILGYSFTKRFTILCHFVLGLGLALAPIGAYLAVSGSWSYLPILFSIIVFLWVSGFDILYSLQDVEFDKEEALRSIPAVFGTIKARVLSAMIHSAATFIVVKAGILMDTGYLYWIGALIFILLLIAQHIIIKPNSAHRINLAFATLNSIASLVYAIFIILSLYY
ncbi:MAG: UbiA-like polyprenyltransferase [Perlabentimonas sp.]